MMADLFRRAVLVCVNLPTTLFFLIPFAPCPIHCALFAKWVGNHNRVPASKATVPTHSIYNARPVPHPLRAFCEMGGKPQPRPGRKDNRPHPIPSTTPAPPAAPKVV